MGRGPLQGVDRHSRRLIGRRAGGTEEALLPPEQNIFGAHRALSGSDRPASSSASSGG